MDSHPELDSDLVHHAVEESFHEEHNGDVLRWGFLCCELPEQGLAGLDFVEIWS